jgi:hypothetical protein
VRNAVRSLIATLMLVASSFAGVTISSPAPGSTFGSPVHFVASAFSSLPITAMRIYVDNVSVFTIYTNRIDTYVSMSAGTHYVVVQAWDSSGAVFKAPESLTVGTSGGPPSGSTQRTQIQAMPGWGSCTVCAGIGANGPVAYYSLYQNQNSPSLSGRSAKFSISGPTPWANVIWWEELGPSDASTHFQYDVDFYLTAPQNAFVLEFDANQTSNSRRFTFGTQCGIHYDGQWDVWDTAAGVWRNTGIPCAVPSAYQWHHLTWEFYRDSTYLHFVAVTVDGVKHYANVAYPSRAWSNSPELNVAFQMDGDSQMHPYSVWLDNLTLTYW